MYGITHDNSKTKVIETLGDDYIENTNVELDGSRYFDRLVYEKLGLTIIFNQDQVISITVKVNDQKNLNVSTIPIMEVSIIMKEAQILYLNKM